MNMCVMTLQFSEDGKYFAYISIDGKLKIWDTVCNCLEQEFTPDIHLTSPCISLQFLPMNVSVNSESSLKKKRRRESNASVCQNLALGTSSGFLLVYSLTTANLECTINSETNQSVNCLSVVDDNIVYSGTDQDIFIWSIKKQKLLKKWKGGNEKITSILAIPDTNQILTASKIIKLWDVEIKEVLNIFTGHSSDIIFLQYVNPRLTEGTYFISGSKGDRLLSCWSLNNNGSNKNAVAIFQTEDIVQSVSINIARDGSTNLAATVRSGVVHVYKHKINGKSSKPLKPKTTLRIVTDVGQSNDLVVPIKIIGATFRDDETLCIGHGTELILTFENVQVSEYLKVQCLIRKDSKIPVPSKEEKASKIKLPVFDTNVQYLTPQTSSVRITKRKSGGTMDIPMEKRLENLTLTQGISSDVPKVDNMAQLLIQGLHSKDQNILKAVLCKREESIVKNTVKKLPVPVLIPLIKESTSYLNGKTLSSEIGCLWLKHILQVHASVLISNPELQELLGPLIGSVENRLTLLTPLHRLKGRLNLLLSQISSKGSGYVQAEEPLLVFDDRDGSESDED